ncbi:hypothetical protein [Staphylococcus pasteuri]|uniref:hypothetical protein n=1 Tax=Staphylococcus pasteuri TaxID=45972 RepID=UPI0012FD27B4|nr:hypothetical protein [Staphylococcus pasteuri]
MNSNKKFLKLLKIRGILCITSLQFSLVLVQLIDGIIGITIKNKLKTFGPFSLAIIGFILLTFI